MLPKLLGKFGALMRASADFKLQHVPSLFTLVPTAKGFQGNFLKEAGGGK